jgi:hypothetical protein
MGSVERHRRVGSNGTEEQAVVTRYGCGRGELFEG